MHILLLAAALTSFDQIPTPAAILDSALAPMAENSRPGCAAGLIENGRLSHVRAAGLADIAARVPITPATPFNIASMSKQFTAAAALLLMAEGKLSADDDIRRYLPELRDYGQVIRVRDLLQHSSGLRNHMALAAFQPGDGLPTHAEALALVFRQTALNFAPGTRHQYESPSYVILAEIVARAAGKPFDEVLAERIFRPLGMTHTGFSVPDRARAYDAGSNGYTLNERVNQARGSSGLYSTVEDMAKWLDALAGGQFGGPDFLPRMTAGGRLADGTAVNYGQGLSIDRGPGDLIAIGHAGQTAAYRSRFYYIPARRSGVVMLCNVSDAPLAASAQALTSLRAQLGLTKIDEPGPPIVPLAANEAALYSGSYRDPATDTVRTFVAENNNLRLIYYGNSFSLAPIGNHRFTFGDDITFTFGPDWVRIQEPNQPETTSRRLPRPNDLPAAPYAGTYRTPDLDTELVLSADGTDLLLTHKGQLVRLKPIGPNSFSAPEADFVHVVFTRDGDRVTGLTLTTGSGINQMRFTKAAPAG